MLELMTLGLALISGGYLLRRFGLVRSEAASDLSRIVFYITLPLLIFLNLHRSDLSWSFLLMPAAAWFFMLAGTGIMYHLTKYLKLPGPTAGALIIVTVFGNTTYFGYPIVLGFYGEEALTLAIFYDLLGSSIAVNTMGLAIAGMLGSGERVKLQKILKRLLLFPAVWGMILAFLLHGIKLPGTLENLIENIGSMSTPLILLSIGITLRFSTWREDIRLVSLAAFIKLAVFPLVAWLLLNLLGYPPEMIQVAVLQAGMPTMLFSLTVALIFNLRKTLVVNAIMLSTLVSFITLPLWRLFLGP